MLKINGIDFMSLEEAVSTRERADLARAPTFIDMTGIKKTGKYPVLRRGVYTGIMVSYNK
jgi:hypothetical protein